MNYERQTQLVQRLLEKSRLGQLDWQEGVHSNVYQVSFSKYTVQISLLGAGEPIFCRIEIKDSYGNTTESFDSDDLNAYSPSSDRNWFEDMREIFLIARRKAAGADEALDSILAEIG